MKYLEQGFKTAKDFTKIYKNKGLLILFGNEYDVRKITSSMDGDLARKYISKYGRNILYKDDIVMRLYEEMAEQDGAIGFDEEGNLIDTGLMIKGVNRDEIPDLTLKKIKQFKRNEGTRHISAAYASIKGIPSIAVSEEVGTIMTFVKGYFYPSLLAINDSVEEITNRTLENCHLIKNKLNSISRAQLNRIAYI